MLRKSLISSRLPVTLQPWYKTRCAWVCSITIIQCILVYIGSFTVLQCFWSPANSTMDFDKLVRIMYLYDYKTCGYKLRTASNLSNIKLSNDTLGLEISPIEWKQAVVTVSTRLSFKTRRYIDVSLVIHGFWLITAIAMLVTLKRSKNDSILKFMVTLFFYTCVSVVIFDFSMAIVYVADIQQSLTSGMVLRHSGWGVELELDNYDSFAGWFPLVASIMWMRGIALVCWNIYSCNIMNHIRRIIKKREVKMRIITHGYTAIPEPEELTCKENVLYFRTGEQTPFVKKGFLNRTF